MTDRWYELKFLDEEYARDKAWARGFEPAVDKVIESLRARLYPIRIATRHEDTRRATDVVIPAQRSIAIAVRVRRPGYYEDWPNQFTVRSYRESKTGRVEIETELKKFYDGYCDYMVYGHGDEDGKTLRGHVIVDLSIFRSELRRYGWTPGKPIAEPGIWGERRNDDGKTRLMWVECPKLDANLVIDIVRPKIILRERSKYVRCGICNAYHGQLVWRSKANWRLVYPGPIEGSKDHPQAREREADTQAFIKASGLYHDRLEKIEVGANGLCALCAQQSKKDPGYPCPRCKPVAPPWLKTPCQLCGGSGVLKGAQSLESVVNRITDALQTGRSQTK